MATAVQFSSYGNFSNDKFWLLLCVAIALLLSGFAYLIFHIRKRNKQMRDTACRKAMASVKETTYTPHFFVEVPTRYREVFVQTMEEDLGILNQALQEDRTRAVLSMLHRMHGALVAVGMTEFAQRCELLGRTGGLLGMEDELKKDIKELAQDLMRMVQWQHTI